MMILQWFQLHDHDLYAKTICWYFLLKIHLHILSILNSMNMIYVSNAFMIQFIKLFMTFIWCSTVNSLIMLHMIRAYIVNSSCRAFTKLFVINNLNTCLFTLKHHVHAIMFIQIRLNCIFNILNSSDHHNTTEIIFNYLQNRYLKFMLINRINILVLIAVIAIKNIYVLR